MTLIPRIEQATAEQVRELLEEAWNTIAPGRGVSWALANARRFTVMLDAEAWTSAAEMLVPETHFWSICMKGGATGFSACCQARGDALERSDAATPALALAAACLRAKGLQAGSHSGTCTA